LKPEPTRPDCAQRVVRTGRRIHLPAGFALLLNRNGTRSSTPQVPSRTHPPARGTTETWRNLQNA
jgi:hypothetical protein